VTHPLSLCITRRRFLATGTLLLAGAHRLTAQPRTSKPLKIGIIGSGRQGGAIGRLWARAGHQILFSSRNPDSLKALVAEAGETARAGTPSQAAEFGDVVLIAVPYGALPQVGRDYAPQLKGKIVIDVGNPRVDRDGDVGKDGLARGTGVTSREHVPGVRLVRARRTARHASAGTIWRTPESHLLMTSMISRRTLLATGTLAAAGSAWTALSSSWSARFLRDRLAEWGREVPAAPHRPSPRPGTTTPSPWPGSAMPPCSSTSTGSASSPTRCCSTASAWTWVGSLGPQRLVQCALTPDELPELDLVLVSHAHFDHLDTPSLAAVRGRPVAVMAAETADLLPRAAYAAVHELRWNETTRVITPRGEALVRAIEVRHWGARIQRDTHRGYGGFIIEREGRRLLIGGDTADTPLFRGHRRYGPFEAAIMPIGAYDPWITNHCTPEQAVTMADAAGARLFVPVHHQSFSLSREPLAEPIERTMQALQAEHDRLALRAIGETRIVSA
jgi:L-ascorbate metabolism protein UlaG (beta-lactamase superfamily)